MESWVSQEGLQALGVHLEEGLHVCSHIIQCMELQECEALAEPVKELPHSPVCLVEVLGSVLHLLYPCFPLAAVEQCLVDQLLQVPLALQQLSMVFPISQCSSWMGLGAVEVDCRGRASGE